MIAFNLERALAGEKVVTRDGREATQIVLKETEEGYANIYALVDGKVLSFYKGGVYIILDKHNNNNDLFMAAPKKLSGFINDYATHEPAWYSTRETADMEFNTTKVRTACIDLSQFEEGYGLLNTKLS
jgi:frataxin-like iron-binding protein CyaY